MAEVEDDGKALESLGRILRCLGRHSFDLEDRSEEEIEKEFERWAMHVLVGVSIRDEEAEFEEGPLRRDWGELTKIVKRHRQQEKNMLIAIYRMCETFCGNLRTRWDEPLWKIKNLINK
jgi:hypothetical protein